MTLTPIATAHGLVVRSVQAGRSPRGPNVASRSVPEHCAPISWREGRVDQEHSLALFTVPWRHHQRPPYRLVAVARDDRTYNPRVDFSSPARRSGCEASAGQSCAAIRHSVRHIANQFIELPPCGFCVAR
jgi:hypothetical protein